MKKTILRTFSPLLALMIVGCGTKESKLLAYKPTGYPSLRQGLLDKFGPPDSVVVICENDTSLLYKVESGCVEWRLMPRKDIRYSVEKNDSCKISEGQYIFHEFGEGESFARHRWEFLDTVLSESKADSAIAITFTSHYNEQAFLFTSEDIGEERRIFERLVSTNLENKKSIEDRYCSRLGGNNYLKIRFKGKDHQIYIGASNFPDSSYLLLDKTLGEISSGYFGKGKGKRER